MGTVTAVESADVDRRRIDRRAVWIAIAITVVAVGLATWWFRGVDHLFVEGDRVGMTGPEGTLLSFGVLATGDGDEVVLKSVSAKVVPDAPVTWSIYETGPGGSGIGVVSGPLEPRWDTVAVDGFRVTTRRGSPELGETFLVGSVAPPVGLYRISDIAVTYRSGWRTRTAHSARVVCALVYPATTSFENLQQVNDPLMQEYNRCNDG